MPKYDGFDLDLQSTKVGEEEVILNITAPSLMCPYTEGSEANCCM